MFQTIIHPGVRDYIHVVDLALGHVAALKLMLKETCGFKVNALWCCLYELRSIYLLLVQPRV